MSEFVAMVRDDAGNGVRCDRVEGWEAKSGLGKTRIYLAGGGIVDLRILVNEFVSRLDRALTAMSQGGDDE